MSAISVKNLSFCYGSYPVLKNVTCNIAEGQYVGIIGPNGGGKTTFLSLLLGFQKPHSGSISLLGEHPIKARKNGQIGYVPQRAVQMETPFPATVDEVVRSGFSVLALKNRTVDRLLAAYDVTDTGNLKTRLISELSGGQRQRVFIARALVTDPKLLLLDEPVTGVDGPSKEKFYALLQTLHERGVTIIFVTHDLDAIVNEVDQVLCINQTLCAHASSHDFLQKHVLSDLYANHPAHA